MTVRAGQVSGHYAGAFTRLAAFVVDWLIILAVYGFILASASFVLELLAGLEVDFAAADPIWYWIGFGSWAFVYMGFGLAITGRTIGKGLVGLKVVTREGAPISPGRAAVRVLVMPISFALVGLGFLGIILGRERRALHDVISGCAVVYDWGDRPAELPTPLARFLENRAQVPTP
jgi:uncharacterized RDD family membrane protein YckC